MAIMPLMYWPSAIVMLGSQPNVYWGASAWV
jgi:hypothetical protein